jgi:CheY-like chemotaxis protein
MKTLIIDDDPVLCSILKESLAKIGMPDVIVSGDGEDAAWQFTEHEFSIGLILCDLNMPKLDGVEFADFLSERESHPAIVFITSAHDSVRKSAVALAKARKLNVLGSLKKPISIEQLSELLSLQDAPRGPVGRVAYA